MKKLDYQDTFQYVKRDDVKFLVKYKKITGLYTYVRHFDNARKMREYIDKINPYHYIEIYLL